MIQWYSPVFNVSVQRTLQLPFWISNYQNWSTWTWDMGIIINPFHCIIRVPHTYVYNSCNIVAIVNSTTRLVRANKDNRFTLKKRSKPTSYHWDIIIWRPMVDCCYYAVMNTTNRNLVKPDALAMPFGPFNYKVLYCSM